MKAARPLFALFTALTLPTLAEQPDTLIYAIPPPHGAMQTAASFGASVAVDGGYIVAGMPYDDRSGDRPGAVKVFDSASGALLHIIRNPQEGAGEFGYAVAISGTRLVVGGAYDGLVNSGKAYVYDLISATPTVPVVTLDNPSPGWGDEFGISVAISGTRVVVGAHEDYIGNSDAGSAYVYDLTGAAPTVLIATLNNPSPADRDYFGYSVAISGTRVVVGAFGNQVGTHFAAGSTYIYDLTRTTPTVPVLTLNNPDPALGDYFGRSIALSGTRVVVGAERDDAGASDSGSVYVYDLARATPTIPVATLSNPGPAENDYFGNSVAIHGTRLIVGDYTDNSGASKAGSAYVYDLARPTPTVPVATLRNPGPAMNDYFGYSVALSGSRIVVGAYGDDTGAGNAGSAYVYDLSGATPILPVATLNHPGPEANDHFGLPVAISGTLMVVGAGAENTGAGAAGSAYVYDLASATPTVPVATLNNPGPAVEDHFGHSVAISTTRVVVGAFGDDAGAVNAGSAYVFDLTSGTPAVPIITLNNPSPAALDQFGNAVAISGTRVVVAASGNDLGGRDAGSAYVYDLASATPAVPVATLNNPEPGVEDYFGHSVAISGTRVVVGAYKDGADGYNAGSAYVYDLASATPIVPIATLVSPGGGGADWFGHSVAISGARVLVGAAGNPVRSDNGSAYVFDLASATPTVPVFALHDPNVSPEVKSFGYSVAISGTRVVVGDYGVSAGTYDDGSAYVYDLAGSTPTVPVVTLNNPSPAMNDLFGQSVAIDGVTVAIGAPGDDTLMYDKGYAYVFGPNITATQAPRLTAPESNALTRSPVAVNFTLPEAALAGSMKLSFGDTQLTLAASQETSGAHSFSFDPANPAASPQIVTGEPFADGTYTVKLSYQDALGNPVAAAFSSNVRIDMTPPVLTLPASITVETDGPSGAVVAYIASASDPGGIGMALSSFLPLSGSRFPPGTTTVNASATDFAGNTATGSFTVTVLGPLESWKLSNLGDAQAPDVGDPDGDGIATLAEYGLVLPPGSHSQPPEVDLCTCVEGQSLRMFVSRDPARFDVTVEVQAAGSPDGPWTTLATSMTGTPFTGPGYVTGDNTSPGVKTVEVRDTANVADALRRFMRVQVSR